jgi:hypothetical protein
VQGLAPVAGQPSPEALLSRKPSHCCCVPSGVRSLAPPKSGPALKQPLAIHPLLRPERPSSLPARPTGPGPSPPDVPRGLKGRSVLRPVLLGLLPPDTETGVAVSAGGPRSPLGGTWGPKAKDRSKSFRCGHAPGWREPGTPCAITSDVESTEPSKPSCASGSEVGSAQSLHGDRSSSVDLTQKPSSLSSLSGSSISGGISSGRCANGWSLEGSSISAASHADSSGSKRGLVAQRAITAVSGGAFVSGGVSTVSSPPAA